MLQQLPLHAINNKTSQKLRQTIDRAQFGNYSTTTFSIQNELCANYAQIESN